MPEILTLDQAAARLGIHVQTLRAWVRGGLVPSYRIGRRFARVDWDTVLDALRRQAPSASRQGG